MPARFATPPHTFCLSKRVIARVATLLGSSALLLPLPGCQSITGNPSVSQVRIIDASPDAPGLDIYQGTSILAYNLGLGTITSYVPLTPGSYTISADSAGTKQQLVSASGTFSSEAQYTVLIGNYSNSLQELILKDQVIPAATGQIDLRFIDQSVRGGTLDLYLVPTGSTIVSVKPLLTGIAFNSNTGYLNIPTGTYTLVALPSGTVPTATGSTSYTGSAIAYTSGSASTIVLIDQQVVTTPGIQVVIANDYTPPGAA